MPPTLQVRLSPTPLHPLNPDAADTKAGSSPPTLQVRFSVTRDVLVLLLPREVVLFDLDLGVPASMQVGVNGVSGVNSVESVDTSRGLMPLTPCLPHVTPFPMRCLLPSPPTIL